jgi:hypothetical protein
MQRFQKKRPSKSKKEKKRILKAQKSKKEKNRDPAATAEGGGCFRPGE